jgi:hypothetical protein
MSQYETVIGPYILTYWETNDWGVLKRLLVQTVEDNGLFRTYYLGNRMHREDGPAFIFNSHKEWWLRGCRHRDDGPAIVAENGTKKWYKHGRLYRIRS